MNWGFFFRVVIKAAALFVILNLLFAALNPVSTLGKVSLYNTVFPGRERLPYGENPALAYNLSINDLNAMFASHELTENKEDFRVVLIGDSSTWGFLLEPADTLASQLNDLLDGIQVYNLGYPTMSLTKDLLIMEQAMQYEPDLIVWLVTLESFPRQEQLDSPPLQYNPNITRDLIERYDLNLDTEDSRFKDAEFIDRTLVGQRRALADWLRFQVYGAMWATTGIDQYIPDSYTLRQSDFDEDISWKNLTEPQPLTDEMLVWDVLAAGMDREIPVLLINEPMFISSGQNSDLRYNFFYPRWVYDDYRQQLGDLAADKGWHYLDWWDIMPPEEFTDSPVHLTPAGSRLLAERLAPEIIRFKGE